MPLATTKIWPVRDSLRRVVDYAANPDKTEYSGLAQALHYAENGEKTILRETAQLVSGVHCRPATAWAEMRAGAGAVRQNRRSSGHARLPEFQAPGR